MLCCVGFLSVSSRAYAYTAEDGFYPINSSKGRLYLSDSNDTRLYDVVVDVNSTDNCYYYSNGIIENIAHMIWSPDPSNDVFTFPYLPEKYDYYLLGSVVSYTTNLSDTTFKPTDVYISAFDVSTNTKFAYPRSELKIYNIDNNDYKGFGFSEKVDFSSKNNLGISSVYMGYDKDGSGTKPANLIVELGIMAVEKGTDENAINQQILNKLDQMNDSMVSGFDQVTDSVHNAADQVTGAIENQYGMASGEDFGVQDLTSQVEEKLGVLSFGADTLNNFLGLFQASNAGSTVLTFPGFTIDVQGESYQVWNDMQFDLAFLEENFGILITAVRTVTVLCVWLAVLGYLVKAYEHLINNKG